MYDTDDLRSAIEYLLDHGCDPDDLIDMVDGIICDIEAEDEAERTPVQEWMDDTLAANGFDIPMHIDDAIELLVVSLIDAMEDSTMVTEDDVKTLIKHYQEDVKVAQQVVGQNFDEVIKQLVDELFGKLIGANKSQSVENAEPIGKASPPVQCVKHNVPAMGDKAAIDAFFKKLGI